MSLEFTTKLTEFYKDDLNNINTWKEIYKLYENKFFTSVEDCTKDKVKDYLSAAPTFGNVLVYIANEGKKLKEAHPEAIKALANVLNLNPEKKAEIRFLVYFLKEERLLEHTEVRNFYKVLSITNFTKKTGYNRHIRDIHLELLRKYRMIKDNSVPKKSQKTSVNQEYPVKPLIDELTDDLKKSQDNYKDSTFYNKKHQSLIDFIELLKKKLKISEKLIQTLQSNCIHDKSFFFTYVIGLSPLLASVEGEAKKIGLKIPEHEEIHELTQGDSDDDDSDSDGNGGEQEEEDQSVAQAKVATNGKSNQHGSSQWVDKGFNSSSSDSESDEELDGGFKKPKEKKILVPV